MEILKICGHCESFAPLPPGTGLFQGGWWMGEGRCLEQEPPHNIGVRGDTCELFVARQDLTDGKEEERREDDG